MDKGLTACGDKSLPHDQPDVVCITHQPSGTTTYKETQIRISTSKSILVADHFWKYSSISTLSLHHMKIGKIDPVRA